MATTAPSLRATQSLHSDWHHNVFSFESHIKTDLPLKLETDSQICQLALRGLCPLGTRCPLRHVSPSPLNFLPPSVPVRDPNKRTVCKHWLRGLCKKGDACDYLHEYDLRRMPECRFFAQYGFCSSGDECLYLHVDPKAKVRECPDYRRGFCAKGPTCPKKHVRRVACPYYLAGFCPQGPECRMGHPKTSQPSATSRSNSPVPSTRPMHHPDGFAPRQQQQRFGDSDHRGDRFQPYPTRERDGPGAGGQDGGERKGWRKNLDDVLCFKCGERGHFANTCPNPNRPGNRGGRERGPGGRERPGMGGNSTGGSGGGWGADGGFGSPAP